MKHVVYRQKLLLETLSDAKHLRIYLQFWLDNNKTIVEVGGNFGFENQQVANYIYWLKEPTSQMPLYYTMSVATFYWLD